MGGKREGELVDAAHTYTHTRTPTYATHRSLLVTVPYRLSAIHLELTLLLLRVAVCVALLVSRNLVLALRVGWWMLS